AYTSTESGRPEVYVRPFPGPGGKTQVSTNGGTDATWSKARPELFFGTPDQLIMMATYTVDGDVFRPDKPRPWADVHFATVASPPSFALHPDGNRFAIALAPERSTAAKQDKVVLVFNFLDELRRIVPSRK